ncbi:hypothetical protein JOF56_010081 [Kibdelosporangium banguiense]|uniref:Uncharacterized protein n=1 Tax=Kibdelosporangium banguiense TaxID=1365924 RepID=A0ABS4U0K2_9PSEU|nr:hypothetical protein [Kibdelosporangium banguiense]MBP2329696.1 hypothetical protein [Kibdelosporangium banguiense]
MAGFDEGDALILWCTRLPELRKEAMAGRWTDRLERAVVRVREGGSALDACRQFDQLDEEPEESPTRDADPGSGHVYPRPRGSRPPLTGRGNYGCPRRLCARMDQRDDKGHPPVCALFDNEPMQPTDAGP